MNTAHQGCTFVVTINTRSDAFTGDGFTVELRRCLADVWHRIELYPMVTEGVIRDVNGNGIGVFGFEPQGDGREDDPCLPTKPEPDSGLLQ